MRKRLISLVLILLLISGCKNNSTSDSSTSDNTVFSEITEISTAEQTTEAVTDTDELRLVLEGKYVSILGDSISTYEGVSNSTQNNSTLGVNYGYYSLQTGEIPNQTFTYWGQIIRKYNMELLVNNSSGSNLLTLDTQDPKPGYIRVEELAANMGKLNGTKPDYIFLYMGTNDFLHWVEPGTPDFKNTDINATPKTFAEAYVITIEKAIKLYPDAKILCFTLLPASDGSNRVLNYNKVIKEVAAYYGNRTILVDIFLKSGITSANLGTYTSDGIHPNFKGMSTITEVIENALVTR